MAGRDYERLPIEVFGRQLITSGDLDPVYIALVSMRDNGVMGHDQLCRWLVAYWCWYHCGAACYISEHTGHSFWEKMNTAARNELPTPQGGRWPRGHERRHARGEQGVNMVSDLRARYGDRPDEMVELLRKRSAGGIMFAELAKLVKQHRLFGPWIAFKVGDMLERVLGCPVNFEQADVFMFKDPTKAAVMLWRLKEGIPESASPRHPERVVRGSVEYLKDVFKDLRAPPHGDRAIDLQEVETVLCKWKSHRNGHYPLFNDIDEIRDGLGLWGETAELFDKAMPRRDES